MRLLKSAPKNRDFYNEHGRNLRAFATIANLGQLLSAASLSLAVFSILRDAIAGRGMSVATGGIIAAAVLVGLFIELANRQLVRPALRPLVVKDQFANDPIRQKRHRVLTKFSRVGLFLVGSLSFALSFVGSMDAGQLITDLPPPANLDSLQKVFAADTAALFAPLRLQADAAAQQFEATRNNREKAAQDYASCARKGNKWCKKKRRAILAQIDAARADFNVTRANIAAQRSHLLTAALSNRDATITTARNDADVATKEAERDAAGTGYIFAVLTFAGQVVFYLMYYLILQITAGSEIEEKLEPNEFADRPPVLADLRAVLAHRVERGSRRLISKVFGDRERLDGSLPYVTVWNDATKEPPNELKPPESDGHHPPGFYRAADDPRTQSDRVTFNTQKDTSTPAPHTNAAHETPEAKKIHSRLMQYRRRLGEHTQKAAAQKRKNGEITARTAAAIENNRKWVEHYKQQLNNLTNA